MIFLMLLPVVAAVIIDDELAQTIPTKDGYVDFEAVFGPDERMSLDFIDTVTFDKAQGIRVNGATEFFVTTPDGYILRVFHMTPLPECEGKSKGPLIWWHGLFLGANCCIILGEGCQCYKYLQACYDVYVPNSRGNRYSRNHTTLNPDKDKAFWAFGLKEMAMNDVPAVIDAVLQKSGATAVIGVAHSQGITLFVLSCALKPEYNAKILVAFGQSPTFDLRHSTSPLLFLDSATAPALSIAIAFGYNGEIFPYRGLVSTLAKLLCAQTTLSYPLCLCFVYAILGYNELEISERALRNTVMKEPSGTSVYLFTQWGKIKSFGFKDEKGNDFPLDKVTFKLRFLVSPNDNVADLRDVQDFLPQLPNTSCEVCILSDKYFGHLDHFAGIHSPLYDADWVLTYLETGTSAGCVGRTVVAPDTRLIT